MYIITAKWDSLKKIQAGLSKEDEDTAEHLFCKCVAFAYSKRSVLNRGASITAVAVKRAAPVDLI